MHMHTKRILKDDGRYLVFYWFDNEPEPVVEPPAPDKSKIQNPKSEIKNV